MAEIGISIDNWLHYLEQEQQRAKNLGLPEGSIPSLRSYPFVGIKRYDPNVFFPALVANKLNEWSNLFTPQQADRAQQIVSGITDTFPLYKSRRGRMHYNFWPTRPDLPFPNGWFLHHFDFFRLPDDIDDTALVYKALAADKKAVLALQKDIETHLSTHYPHQPKIYAAWLGDKMPWVVDACAIINLISLCQKHQLAPTEFSTNSEAHIERVVVEELYLKDPYDTAPYYPDAAVIAYHLSKWLAEKEKEGALSRVFRTTIKTELAKERHPFRTMLYRICLLRLQEKNVTSDEILLTNKDLNYPWFYGTMLSAVESGWLRGMGRFKLFQIAHSCEAWNRTLWMEYLILSKH